MSFPAYPSYKDSGVEWLGEVPSHWGTVPVKRVIDFQTGWTPPTGRDDLYGGPNPWVTISDLSGRVITETTKQVTDEAVELVGISPSPAGSLLFSFKLSIGQVAFAGCDLYTNEAIATFLPSDEVNLEFAYYAFPVFIVQNAAENIYGAKLLNQELIRNAPLALPPVHEQAAIGAFLDGETAKIDALVEEQQRLIALLKEKRQAVISHAVTKGLNPDAPMADSGIEWLGEVPTHWEVKRLKHIVPSVTVGIVVEPSKFYVEEPGVPALRSLNVRPGRIAEEGLVYISEEANALHRKSRLNAGDIVVVRTGQPGTAAVVPPHLDGSNCVDLIVIRKPERGCEQFICWYLASAAAVQQFTEGSGGAIQQHFNIGTAVNLVVPVPPPDEQRLIAAHLAAQTAALDSLRSSAEDAIQLLQERRAALISAAVTGKIDVCARADVRAQAA